jgi:penicillin-binding protein 2
VFEGDTVNLGVGQGYFVATPIQLANYASILANKGKGFELSLVMNSEEYYMPQIWQNNEYSELDWKRMHQALTDVIESDYGTARSIRDLKTF